MEITDRLLRPRSIAIIGASDDGTKASGRPLRNLRRYGFTGAIYPVNPARSVVQGESAHPSVDALPEVPDLAIVVLPAAGVAEAVRACGRKGIGVAIVFASGFAETGDAGTEAERELAEAARESRVRVLGPNCVGSVGTEAGATCTFMTGLDRDDLDLHDDGVGFVSQSGAMGGFIFNLAQTSGLGLGRFVSTGNEVDISFAEIMAGMVSDPSTKAVLGYLEGVRDPERFRSVLAEAGERDVPVALMKVGRSSVGAAAARSHTGALVGHDAAFEGLLEQHGVFRAHDLDQLRDLGVVLSSHRAAAGRRLGILSISGGAGILLADAAADLGLEVPRWDDEWSRRIGEVLPTFAATRNPIDTTGAVAADPAILKHALEVCAAHPHTDVVVVMLGNLDRESDVLCADIVRAASVTDKPIIVIWVGGSTRTMRRLADAGIPAFPEPLRGMRAVKALVRRSSNESDHRRQVVVSSPTAGGALDVEHDAVVLDEVEGKEMLRSYGVPTVAERAVTSPDEVVDAAEDIGFPVAVKLLSRDVAHKSDHGLVRLGLSDPRHALQAAREIMDAAGNLGVADRRLVVQRHVPGETALILGMAMDAVFGPVIALGFGGVLAEVIADTQVRVPPLAAQDVTSMLAGLRSNLLLHGVRGRPAADMEALRRVVLAFSTMIEQEADTLLACEINPLLIDDEGHPVAVDALVLRRRGNP